MGFFFLTIVDAIRTKWNEFCDYEFDNSKEDG